MKSEWRKIKVGDLGEVITGKTPKTSVLENYGGSTPFLTPSDNMSVKYVTRTARTLSSKGLDEVRKKLLPADSVCVSCIGSDLGKVVMTTEPTVTNQQINSVVVDTSRFNPSFVYYAMTILGKQLNFIGKTSTAVPIVNKASFSSYEILCPSLNTQSKISSVLSSLDNKISLNQKINDNLDQQAQALFTSWFVDYSQFGGSVPHNWKEIRFEDFLTASKEKSDNPEIPMYSVTDTGIHPRDEKFKKNLSMKHAKNKVIHQNNLVFGMSREILNWGVMRDPIGGVSSAYNVYEVSKRVNSFYLEAYMKANIQYFKDLIKPAAREGQGIDKAVLMQKILLLPPDEVLDTYYQLENPLREIQKTLAVEIQNLKQIRDTLLPKLMSGEIDVSDISM